MSKCITKLRRFTQINMMLWLIDWVQINHLSLISTATTSVDGKDIVSFNTLFGPNSLSTEAMQSKKTLSSSPSWLLIVLGCNKDDHAHHYLFPTPSVSLHFFFFILNISALLLWCTSNTHSIHSVSNFNPFKIHGAVFRLSCIHFIHMLFVIKKRVVVFRFLLCSLVSCSLLLV